MGMYLTRSETLSEELVQDVFLKVWKNRDQLPALHYFNAWLRTIASNTCSNYLRSMAIERLALTQLVSEQSVSVESAEEGVIGKEIEKIIEAAIQKLPPQQKKVYLLSRKFSKRQEEIAGELDISIYTVKEYMKLAQRSIRRHLEKEMELISVAVAVFYFQ